MTEAKPYDLDHDRDLCNRPFCRKCSGYHHGYCEGISTIIRMGGWCRDHRTHHRLGVNDESLASK